MATEAGSLVDEKRNGVRIEEPPEDREVEVIGVEELERLRRHAQVLEETLAKVVQERNLYRSMVHALTG